MSVLNTLHVIRSNERRKKNLRKFRSPFRGRGYVAADLDRFRATLNLTQCADMASSAQLQGKRVLRRGSQRGGRWNRCTANAGEKLNRPLRVAVVGGGPAGACAADELAKRGVETFLIERKMDNCKPCGGAIPLCMVDEFDLPSDIIDRKVNEMKMVSPSNVVVDVGHTLKQDEYIGMTRREILDDFLRQRAASNGAQLLNGLTMRVDVPGENDKHQQYTVKYNSYEGEGSAGIARELQVDAVIGADGANSKVAKAIDAGEYDYAIAFQERMAIDQNQMDYYSNMAEMYVGDDVSPDFYGWVFPKKDHVAVGTGTVINKTSIKGYQKAIRDRSEPKVRDGRIFKVEAHPIPEHPRPRRVKGNVALVGDAAGYVTKCSGEGIYFAAKSGRMCAEAIAEGSNEGTEMIDESDLRKYLARWDKQYWPTYKVLDTLQKVFYRSNPAREAFVEMCADDYVQRQTFNSYLYKTVASGSPVEDIKLLSNTVGSLFRANALRSAAKTSA